jgi:hypothetical protein
MVITGLGGSGKSVLMRHLFLDCIRDKRYVPIFVELRELSLENCDLTTLISLNLEKHGFNLGDEYLKEAYKLGHFSMFLDGFDEVEFSKRERLIREIKTFSNKFGKCPIFIATRPDEQFNGIDQFSIFKINPLSKDKATELVINLPFDLDIKNKFIEDLESHLFESHESFLSNPLLLSIMLLTYGENAEIPTKLSVFYNQAYEVLFNRHDANKGGYKRQRLTNLDIQDFSHIFSLFSVQSYDKRLVKMSRSQCLELINNGKNMVEFDFESEDYLTDVLSAVCLLIEDGLEISYSHRSFQEYFVALFLLSAKPEIRDGLIDRYLSKVTSDIIFSLMYEMNSDLLERIVIIPQLEEMFEAIGVKRKVGITHAYKFLKLQFNGIGIDTKYLMAFSNSINKQKFSIALRLLRSNAEKEGVEDFTNHETFVTEQLNKYGKGKKSYKVNFEGNSYKTPFINEVLNSSGWLSIKDLQGIHDEFKKLKLKHKQKSKSLENILGL